MPVDRGEGLHGPGAVLALLPADEDPVGAEQIADGAPLGEELRVRQHLGCDSIHLKNITNFLSKRNNKKIKKPEEISSYMSPF